jgi:protein TonB
LQLPLASLILSLLLHLLVVVLIPLIPDSPRPPKKKQPTFVRLVELPDSKPKEHKEKTPDFEIDQQPLRPAPEEPVKSRRKADRDQRVDKEQAPRADDVRDQVAEPPRPMIPPMAPQPEVPTAAEQEKSSLSPPARTVPSRPVEQQPETKSSSRKKPEVAEQQPKNVPPERKEAQPTPQPTRVVPPSAPKSQAAPAVSETPKAPSPPAERAETPTPPPPAATPSPKLSPQQLFPDANTLSRIADRSLGKRERRKEREDVAVGDTVWLNLQHDLLVSFFRRFHDQIERVWNYPTEAAEKGIEGTLQLLIIVDREGKLLDVDLPQSSGSNILDYEAIQAVYRAAPFGPLTSHYPHATLKIRANFRYTLVGKYIYGRP